MTSPHKSLRITATILALTTLAIALFSYSWTRREAIQHLHKSAEERVTHFSLSVFAPTSKYVYMPNLLANSQTVGEALQHSGDKNSISRANALFKRLTAETGAAVIYLMNADGLTIASSNWQDKQSFVGMNYAYRPYFVDALRLGKSSFYGMGVTTAVPGYYLSHVVKRDRAVLGVVVVKVDIRAIASGWDEAAHEVIVTDENGVIFLSSREEWKYRPVHALSDTASAQLKRTRQYETVLQAPLSMEIDEELAADERIVSIEQKNGEETEWVSYFSKSRTLPGSNWTISVLTSMEKSEAEARHAAFLAIGLIALLLLSSMYIMQIRYRNRERKESRLALEKALKALEQEHSSLQTVSQELRQASITDPLTGAFNRRYFLEAIVKMVSAANRHKQPLSIIMVDVDNFKRINDEYGHPAGDKVLQTLSSIYRKALREDDIFARFGGEEFVMALPNTDEQAASLVAERLREEIMRQPVELDGEVLTITVSSGVSQHRQGEKTIEDAIRRADEALYKAKESGRNRVFVQGGNNELRHVKHVG